MREYVILCDQCGRSMTHFGTAREAAAIAMAHNCSIDCQIIVAEIL
jgi:hypothetical protein